MIGIKEKSIGNLTGLTERTKRQRMEEAAWLTWEPFEYEKCRQCKALPICMGGCSYQVVHEAQQNRSVLTLNPCWNGESARRCGR